MKIGTKDVAVFSVALVAALLAAAACDPAFASASSGSSMPWESGMTTFTNSLKGPVAFGVSLAGVVASGAGLIWGGELAAFAKTGINVTLAASTILLASNVLSSLTGVGAAF